MRIALWIAVTGCYAPDPPVGIPCGTDMACPEQLRCSFGTCVEEVAPCKPIEAGTGKLTIPKLSSPITLDGVLDDWPTCFVEVDQQSAGLVRDLGADGKFTPGRFSLAADASRLYVAAEVHSVLPLGDQPPPDVYLNNAISVYFDGDGTFSTARYDADAAQIVVDHANRHAEFQSGNGVIMVPDMASAAKVGDTTFTIELAVQPSSFGLTEFGSSIGFDIGLVGGDGSVMTSELVWFVACKPPQCGCSSDAAPYCDAREFGLATFER